MQVEKLFLYSIFFIFLIICAVCDIRKKEIPLVTVIAGIIFSILIKILEIIFGNTTVISVVYEIFPGLFFVLLSFCTKEKIGYGDGLILIVCGMALGFDQCFIGLCIALLFSSVFSIVLLILHKVKRNSGLPFVPFIAIGMGVCLFV